jgi:polar amino acid transport system permease protein
MMTEQLNFAALWPYWPELLAGIWATLQLTVVTIFGGITLGIIGAALRSNNRNNSNNNSSNHIRWLSGLWGCYVEVIRNTPFIVQLFFIVFGLPSIGLTLTAGQAAILAMLINLGAYSTEIIRAGIEATPKGQWEAARVLGLSKQQAFLSVVLPPALQRIYPALVSQCIMVMLGSSVVSQVSHEELTFVASVIQSRTFLSVETYLLTALIYLLLAILLRQALLAAGRWSFGR